MKIHLFDIVTCDSTVNGIRLDGIYRVTGILRHGELTKFGGLWKLRDISTGKEYEALGRSLMVWKPVSKENNVKALLVVDCQNDFITGSLAVPKAAEIIPVINQIQEKFDCIFHTQDWHPADHSSFQENGGPWPVHCVQGTEGANFHPDLHRAAWHGLVQKGMDKAVDSYSGFYDNEKKHDTGLKDSLKEMNVSEVYICGLALDFCVKATAIDSVNAGFKTFLLVDACRAVCLNPGDEGRALIEMLMAGINLIHSDTN